MTLTRTWGDVASLSLHGFREQKHKEEHRMALGKQIGAFALQPTTHTFGPGAGTALTYQANMAGTVSGERGEGIVALTHYVEAEPGAKSGTWRQYGMVTLKDGTWLGFRAQGTWEWEQNSGTGRYRGTGQLSDGTTYATEFEGEWAAQMWQGRIYEWS
jgi:hypothetical protein